MAKNGVLPQTGGPNVSMLARGLHVFRLWTENVGTAGTQVEAASIFVCGVSHYGHFLVAGSDGLDPAV
jgi:hypothetical protein